MLKSQKLWGDDDAFPIFSGNIIVVRFNDYYPTMLATVYRD